jgi:iron complex outermembrane recepter protein
MEPAMRNKIILLSAAAACALCASQPALAQAAQDEAAAGTQVDELVVTARKREERLLDVPVAVSSVTGAQLERQQIYAVKDIAAITPSLNINSDSVGRAFISIRGVGTTLLDNVQPGVGIFIDGIYQPNTSYLNSPTLGVERIEVLRGPQGTLFGQNTLGGAINVITKQPSDVMEGRVRGAYAGPDDFQSASISLSGPIVAGKLQAGATVGYHKRDGFIENALTGNDVNNLEQQTYRGTLRFLPTDDVTLTLNAYHDVVEGGSTPYALTTGPKVYSDKAQMNVDNVARLVYDGINGKMLAHLEPIDTDLTLIASYDHRDSETSGDADYQPLDLFRSKGASELSTKTIEARFDTRWNDKVSSLFGLFYSKQDTETQSATTIVPLGVTLPAQATSDTDLGAVYGTIFWNIQPDLELTMGLRYDHQHIDFLSGGAASVFEADEWQPRVTLKKSWSEDVMTYASVARGYRGGGTNPPGAPNPVYQGDSVWTYELGAKMQAYDRRLTFTGAIFYNDYKHFIGQNSLAPRTDGAGIIGINLNTGDVKSYGVEAEVVARVTDAWTLTGGGTLMHARITDDSEYVRTTGRQLASDRIIFQPDWQLFLQSDYVVPIGSDTVTFNAGIVAKGERKGSSLSETFSPTLEAYLLTNASIVWQHGNIQAAVFATNLFDTAYYESYIDSSVLSVAGLPALGSLGIIGDRRRVGVRLGVDF